ncbi:MAG: hypothetical protein IPL32_18655 [Chloracidobacterium sp.]|nr:hypothetical protein [Chloracidobacterium sp.]
MPQLPGYNIGNALLDFSPVSNALQSYQKNALAQQQMGMDQQRLDMDKQSHSMQRQNMQRQWSQQDYEKAGGMANAILNMQPGQARAMAHSQFLKQYGDGDHTPEELDPITGPQLAAAHYGKFIDQTKQQMMQLDMQKTRAEIGALNRKGDDPVEAFIMRKLGGGSAPAQPAMPSQGEAIRPQSFNAPAPQQANPNLQLISDEAPQAALAQPQQPDQVDTPWGKMSKADANELAGVMLLSPKFATAGKALLDSIGAPAQSGLSKPAMGALDEKAIGMVDLAARLDGIQAKFKPEYLTYETKAKMYGNSWLDSFEGLRQSIPPEEAKKLEEYTAFRQDAMNNLSEYIKQITGAAMGIQEEGRIRQGMPDPTKDSPRQFEAKMKNSIRATKLAVARFVYLRNKGYDENTLSVMAKQDKLSGVIPMESIEGMIDQRGAQIEEQLRSANPKADPMAIQRETRKMIKQEFGI